MSINVNNNTGFTNTFAINAQKVRAWGSDKLGQISEIMGNKEKNQTIAVLFLTLIAITLVFMFSVYIRDKLSLLNRNNAIMSSNLEKDLKNNGIQSCAHLRDASYCLRDFYIMSSNNSCCGGYLMNDFVDFKPLESVIKLGCRCLDFDIYSKNGQAIVAAGKDNVDDNKYVIKGTYNGLPVDTVFKVIQEIAFDSSICNNYEDPLIINLKIKTNKSNVFKTLAKSLNKHFGSRLLYQKYGYSGKNAGADWGPNGTWNVLDIPMNQLKEKVIISCYDVNKQYLDTDLNEYINLSNAMDHIKYAKNHDLTNAINNDDLIKFNKLGFTICTPDINEFISNPDPTKQFLQGCQVIKMNFSLYGKNLENYINYFKNKNTAFALKPAHLRYKLITLPVPQKQDTANIMDAKNNPVNTVTSISKPDGNLVSFTT